jgi:hypothetical protein
MSRSGPGSSKWRFGSIRPGLASSWPPGPSTVGLRHPDKDCQALDCPGTRPTPVAITPEGHSTPFPGGTGGYDAA